MPGVEKVDESFCKVILTEFLKQTDTPPKTIGKRMGLRLSDDFFSKNEFLKTEVSSELAAVGKKFFEEYFSYSPKLNEETLYLDDFFIKDDKALELIAGIIEVVLSFISEKEISILIEEKKFIIKK